jgi:DNA-binding CsgD family transcriptional regulator
MIGRLRPETDHIAGSARFTQSHNRCGLPRSFASAAMQRLLERDRELETLETSLDEVGHEGATLLLSGSRGTGKTSLVTWTLAMAGERGMQALGACGTESERDMAFGVLRQLLDRPAQLGFASPPPCLGPNQANLRALHGVLVALAELAPVVITVDDAHWVDAASLRFLRFLSRRVRELPIIMLLASTTADAGGSRDLASIGAEAETTSMYLGPLSPRATSALIRARGWPDPRDDLGRACYTATSGNPFMLAALLDELDVGAGADPPRAEQVRTAAPPPVGEMVRGQLARFPAAGRQLARAVSVLGDGAELRIAAGLASIDDSTARDAADALMREGILGPAAPLAFAQPIARSAVYADMPPEARRGAHARAARLLRDARAPADRIASHVVAADLLSEPWALDALRQAARESARIGSTERACAHLRRVLDHPLDPARRVEILRELGVVESCSSIPQAVVSFQEALALSREQGVGTIQVRASLARLMATSLLVSGRARDAIMSLDAAIAELDGEQAELWVVLEAERAGAADLHREHVPAGREPLDRLERSAFRLAGTPGAERLLAVLAYRRMQSGGTAHEVAGLTTRALVGQHMLVDDVGSVPLFLAGRALDLAGRCAEAERTFSEMLERGSLAGSLVARALAHAGRASARLHCGCVDGALADARDALDASVRCGCELITDQLAIACLVQAGIEQGRLDGYPDELERRWPVGHVLNSVFANHLLIARGTLRLAQGMAGAAVADLDSLTHRLEPWGASIEFEWRNPAALAHRELGEGERALALAHESLELAIAWGAPRQLGAALQTVGLIEGGAGVVPRFRQAVEVLEGSEARLEHARAIINLGAAVRESGQLSHGCHLLHTGREQATECGATALAGAAAAQLALAGVPSPERSANGRSAALTSRERRIAQLAAGGMSNPEIAAALVISRKTVEMHLGNVYRKLGVGTRARLAAALEH